MLEVVTVILTTLSGTEAQLTTRSHEMMGTLVTIALVDLTPEQATRAFETAFAEFDRVNQVMNEWRPDSPLSAINAAAGRGGFVKAPADLCEVLRKSLDAAARTGGLFDPTWAALRDLWRFGSDQTNEVPAFEAVKGRCSLVSYNHVEMRPSGSKGGCRIRLKQTGMKLGLGGVAKGWAVDRAVSALRKLGLRDFLVQAGGDLYAAGHRNGRPWRVGIRDPRGAKESYFAQMDVSDAAFSTSGDYERFFVVGENRYHHIIDPRTCFPATASRSATILAPTAVEAEFLTKATFILGGDSALKLAEQWGAAAVLVSNTNQVLVSDSLRGKLQFWNPTP